jgi:hypothetical protein
VGGAAKSEARKRVTEAPEIGAPAPSVTMSLMVQMDKMWLQTDLFDYIIHPKMARVKVH